MVCDANTSRQELLSQSKASKRQKVGIGCEVRLKCEELNERVLLFRKREISGLQQKVQYGVAGVTVVVAFVS